MSNVHLLPERPLAASCVGTLPLTSPSIMDPQLVKVTWIVDL